MWIVEEKLITRNIGRAAGEPRCYSEGWQPLDDEFESAEAAQDFIEEIQPEDDAWARWRYRVRFVAQAS